MYIDLHIETLLQYPYISFGAILFFCLIAVGMFQAYKWEWKLIVFFLILSAVVTLSLLDNLPEEVRGDSGSPSVSGPIQAQDMLLITLGFFSGSLVSLFVLFVKKHLSSKKLKWTKDNK